MHRAHPGGCDRPQTGFVELTTARIFASSDGLMSLFPALPATHCFGGHRLPNPPFSTFRACNALPDGNLPGAASTERFRLTSAQSSQVERFEVGGANAARTFLRSHGISRQDIDIVRTAIALHTTPGIPQYMHPVVALVTAGVEIACSPAWHLADWFCSRRRCEYKTVDPRTRAQDSRINRNRI
jgi:hypothetical protein